MLLKRLYNLPSSNILVIRQILKHWAKEYGAEFPDTYLCFDLETTGLEAEDNLIVEIGHCRIVDGESTTYESRVLDWTQCPVEVEQSWLEWQIAECARSMAARGSQSHMTIERMRDEGENPYEVLQDYLDMFTEAIENREFIVGHNSVKFDIPWIVYQMKDWLDVDFRFYTDRVLDTAAIEKASQLGVFPRPGEPMSAYFLRVMRDPVKGVYSNLDRHCVTKYKLVERYGLNMDDAHTAGFDAMLTHLLMEEFRELSLEGG